MLDANQQELIAHLKNGEQYVLVDAPAGTGKTFCCIQTAKALIEANQIQSFQKILILTFSRNARAQLLKELSKISKESPVHKQIEINNYHSFFKLYLDIYRDILGIQNPLLVIDDDEFVIRLYDYAKEKNTLLTNGFSPNVIDDFHIKDGEPTLVNKESKYKKLSQSTVRMFLERANEFTKETGYICFAQFGSLLCEIINSSTKIARAISHDYPLLILDEYQDTNFFQEQFVSQILQNSRGIFLADKWQMIYSFRGSEVKRLDELPHKYPTIKKITFCEYYRYKGKDDLVEILTSIRNNAMPDYSSLYNGKQVFCKVKCDQNWHLSKGTSNKAQCTVLAKSVYYSTFKEICMLLNLNNSIAILCRRNNVADKLTEIFSENKFYPRTISDTPELARLAKHIKRCFNPVTLNEKVGSVLLIASLCTLNKKIDDETSDALVLINGDSLARKRKPLLRMINQIIRPHNNNCSIGVCIQVISEIISLLEAQEDVIMSFTRTRYVEHCMCDQNLTPTSVDRILMQRQYIDSFTNINPGLYITTIHQSKGKEFDCVFVVDAEGITDEPNLMYVANSRMKSRLYPIKIQFEGRQY